jgi:predicted phage baseplate assembly protein
MWSREDALTFPLCVSTRDDEGRPIPVAAVARGNIVLADHGRTTRETHVPDPTRVQYSRIGYRFRLRQAPLTFGFGRTATVTGPVSRLFDLSPRHAEPHVVVVDGDGSGLTWVAEPDLLGSDPFSTAFVAEPDHDGRALLRFGDGEYGRRPSFPTDPADAEQFRLHAIFRVGVGRSGNIGRDALAHVLQAEQPVAGAAVIVGVRNPLAAWGGVDPEPIERVKAIAPAAFRAETYRAVTEADYEAAAELLPSVARARAEFRWTGSWYTVFVTVDPNGTDELADDLGAEVRRQLDRYRLAGHDLEIRPPIYVALEIEIEVCVAPGHFRADVRSALASALSARRLADGTTGFFHPDRFTFGQPLHLSRLYAAIEAVEGVDSAEVVVFQRYGEEPAGELAVGRVEVGQFEILRLANDPSFPEHGVLTMRLRGGK